jgi:rhodanese-related sulfurtransferase
MPRSIFLSSLLLPACLLASVVASAGKPAVTPQGVADLADAEYVPRIVDVRSPEEFAAGHVPGAVNIPHERIAEHLDELRGAGWVLVYCRSGRRATLAEQSLAEAGIDVRQMQGSWQAWEAAGLPVEAAAVQP